MFAEVNKNLKKYIGYSIYDARCSLMAEVANSYLNWIWWILEPFGNMCVYLVVFGYFFQTTEDHFASYIYIGVTMWAFFNGFIISSANVVRSNRALVINIYVPKYILLMNSILVYGFKMLLSFLLVAICMIISRVDIGLNAVYAIPTLLIYILFCYGCGLIIMDYGVYISDLSAALRILLHIFMYFSGVFYSIEKRVPSPFGTIILHVNPVAFLINSFRNAVLYKQRPEVLFLVIWLIFSVGLIWYGLILVTKHENNYAKVM